MNCISFEFGPAATFDKYFNLHKSQNLMAG
jgi:hypothetical protein